MHWRVMAYSKKCHLTGMLDADFEMSLTIVFWVSRF